MAQWLAEEPWRSHLEAAIDRGDVDRVALLDACLARLQRGGRARDTQAVVALHDVLGPTFDEVAERRRDYLALLPPGSRSPVVVMAQRELRRLHEAGVLTAAELVEQSRSMLLRTEKKVMRDHLALLKVHALAVPGDVDAVVEAASAAFGNAASDIQRAGVDLVAAQAGTASPQALDAALVAASVLPRDLEDRLRARAGIDGAGRRNEAPVAVLTAPHPAPVTPIEDREEAIAELLALVRREDSDMAAIDVERVVEALPRLAARDREGLRQAASSLLDQPWYEHRTGWGIGTMLELLVAELRGRGPARRGGRATSDLRSRARPGGPAQDRGSHGHRPGPTGSALGGAPVVRQRRHPRRCAPHQAGRGEERGAGSPPSSTSSWRCCASTSTASILSRSKRSRRPPVGRLQRGSAAAALTCRRPVPCA